VAIIGCGAVGRKRARNLGDSHLVAVADIDFGKTQELASQFPGCVAVEQWPALAARPDIDVIVVATPNHALAPATLEAVRHGKHVLVEKPGARSAGELIPVLKAAEKADVVVKVGFNHRFHPALAKARQIFASGELGPLMYVRGRYGHGGRLGYDREWRADPAIAGGGELLDQGIHLIDLARWFAGDFVEAGGATATFFWDMPVEDNGFICLKTRTGQVAWLHASCTEWKNLFSFEIFCRNGKLQIDGLGGSYGTERLSQFRMLPQMGPPETTIWEYPDEDRSWHNEFAHFLQCIQRGEQPSGTLQDAQAALSLIEEVYARQKRKPIHRLTTEAAA
jgi:predicted dehydrogenase